SADVLGRGEAEQRLSSLSARHIPRRRSPHARTTGRNQEVNDNRYQRGLSKLTEYTAATAGESHFKIADRLGDIAPDIGKYIIEFAYGDIYTRPNLDNQQRALVTLASLATLGTEPQIELHLNTALTSGLSPNQIVEIFMQLIPYTGFPRVLNALEIAQKVFEQRGATVDTSCQATAHASGDS
ncbi:carboxymuconolactone decarboxylase family protein, partial [Nocardia sp. NPDC003672]